MKPDSKVPPMRTALLVVFMRRVLNEGRMVVKLLLAPVVGFPTT